MEPPEDPRTATIARTATEPTTSFTSKAVEPVALATARMRTAVSRFAARSMRLSSAKSTLVQIGSKATRLSGRPRGIA
jgi:hypothetical protein